LIRRRFFRGLQFDAPEGDPGWFGRDSAVWYVHEHTPTLVLGLFASALIETLHPDFAWMWRDNSRSVERVDGVATGRMDPQGVLERAGHSYSFFMSVAYGSSDSASRVTRALRGMPTVAYLASLAGREQPRVIRPVLRQLKWAVVDLQPDWARSLLRHRSTPVDLIRRTAVWSAVNGLHYGAGPLPEVVAAPRRVSDCPTDRVSPRHIAARWQTGQRAASA
jgi:uncharacterized protein (DUF2236 family)